jgi:hypothetical protein
MYVFSEEFLDQEYTGSSPFCKSFGINHWSQGIVPGPPLPVSPPASDCALSDLDMSAPWSQPVQPHEAWYTGHAHGNSTHVQDDAPTGFVPLQTCLPVADSYYQGTVDMGLSPTQSYSSQSERTISYDFSGSGAAMTPTSFDFALLPDSAWGSSACGTYQRPLVTHGSLPGNAFVPSPDEFALTPITDPVLTAWPHDYVYQGSLAQPRLPDAGCVPAQRTASRSMVPAGRTLLPRTGTRTPVPMTVAPMPSQREIRPLIKSRIEFPRPVQIVSNPVGSQPTGVRMLRPVLIQENAGPVSVRGMMAPAMGNMQSSIWEGQMARTEVPSVSDPVVADFDSFVRYDEDNLPTPIRLANVDGPQVAVTPSTASGAASYSTGYGSANPEFPGVLTAVDCGPTPDAKLDMDAKAIGRSSTATSIVFNDLDEGRHRNHVLYSQGPGADGFYHCPYLAKESCPHKPTKLKCNYEYGCNVLP